MSDRGARAEVRQRIAAALELNDGFQLCFVFGSTSEAQDLVAEAVADAARRTGEPLNLLWFLPDDASALKERGYDAARSVWVVDCGDDEHEVSTRLAELNRRRDSMASHKRTTLLLLLRNTHHNSAAVYAPDLWSVRSLAVPADPNEQGSLAGWESACEDAFEARLVEQPSNRCRYELGTYTFAYGVNPVRRLASVRDLRDLMSQVGGWTGWRPWWVPTNKDAPYSAAADVLECWMVGDGATFPDPAHSDFWRASLDGLFFLRRGYDEDSSAEVPAGEKFSLGLPVWRTAEALFHAQQVAEALSEGFATIEFSATWSGLRGRSATEWPSGLRNDPREVPTRRELVASSTRTDPDELKSGLEAVTKRLLQPLYDAFLATPSNGFVDSNIDEMRRRPVR